MKHDFGPVTADYQVRCRRCGLKQYSAAPEPLIGCVLDGELELRNPFLDNEIKFIMDRLALYRMALERQLVEGGK